MNKLKIFFITPWYPTEENPAIGTFILEHAKAISIKNDIVVLHFAGTKDNLKGVFILERENNEAITSGLTTYRVWTKKTVIPKLSYLLFVYAVYKGINELSRRHFIPDIIHANIYICGVPTVIYGRLHKIPTVISEHSTSFGRNTLNKINKYKASIAFSKSSAVFPVSHALRRQISSLGIKCNYRVIPNIVDTDLFYPINVAKQQMTIKKMLFVGLLDPTHKKGLPVLFKALTKIKQIREDWILDIVGDGIELPHYQEIVDSLGLKEHIYFLGLKSKGEVACIMRSHDIFVLPSIFETFSVATAEALATGLPVIVTKCGGPEEFVDQSNGIIVAANQPEELQDAIVYMLDHFQTYTASLISERVKEKFSADVVSEIFQKEYLNVLSNNKQN